MKQLLYIFTVLSMLFYSCEEADVLAEFNNSDFWESHHRVQWDSTSTANELIGTWVWEYNVCCPLGIAFEGSDKTAENVKVTFTPAAINVSVDGEETTNTQWGIRKIGENLYRLNMADAIPILHGRILFAEDKVLFNASYIDGADNYFYKDFSGN
ncbi:MAG: hypothetical protein AAFQ94_01035 [Bacteroidota bacterium]